MKQRNKQKRRWDFFFSAKPVRFYWSKSHVNIWNLLQPSRWNWFSGCNVGVAIFQWCLTYKFLVSRPCFSTDYITSTCALCYKHVHGKDIYMYIGSVWHTHLSIIFHHSHVVLWDCFPYQIWFCYLCLNAYKQFKHLLLIHLLGFEPFIENFYVYETDQISMKFTQNCSSYFYNYLVVIGFRWLLHLKEIVEIFYSCMQRKVLMQVIDIWNLWMKFLLKM